MGTSSSGDLGSSPRWKETRGELKELAESILEDLAKGILDDAGKKVRARYPRPIPMPTEMEPLPKKRHGRGGGAIGGSKGGPAPTGGSQAISYTKTEPATVRSVPMREFGKHLIKAHQSDPRFLPLLEDGAIKIALDELLALSTAATFRYRTPGEAGELFRDYGLNTEKSIGLGLAKALDGRFKKHLVAESKEITDNAEKVRLAMGSTLIELLDYEGNPDVVIKMSAKEIYTALHKTDSMEIARKFYRDFLFNALQFLVSSNRSGISPVAEKEILHQLRTTYCDAFASELVKRARKKGWRPGEIPEKVDEWRYLLFEEEEAHA